MQIIDSGRKRSVISNDTPHIQEIQDGLHTAYINQDMNSNLAYRPAFVSNDYRSGQKVLTTIEQELQKCDEFTLSVADRKSVV